MIKICEIKAFGNSVADAFFINLKVSRYATTHHG